MAGKKISALNLAIRESIGPMKDVVDGNPQVEVLVRAIKFSDGAHWLVSQPTDIRNFKWTDLEADGVTDMGAALRLLADALRIENMPQRGLPPVIVLVSDGQPTDDFDAALKTFKEQPWGAKAARVAVAIGDDADHDVLQKFIGQGELKPLTAHNVQDLCEKIKWASTVPLKAASSPASQLKTQDVQRTNVPIPTPPTDAVAVSWTDVF